MPTQNEKGRAFQALHRRDEAFIIPNPWDVGTARVLTHLGFEALATTSLGHALSLGQRDNTVDRSRVLEHLSLLASATNLPVSADLGNGFGDAPEIAAETIRLAAMTGAVGGSIEDATGYPDRPIYERGAAVERIRAAAEVAHAFSFPFTLTARAENYLYGRHDLRDTITRLQAYQEAGADVLYAPGIVDKDEIASVVSALDRPVNVLVGLQSSQLSFEALSAIGVRRISVGSALCRTAFAAFLRAAREMREYGTFAFANDAIGTQEITAMFVNATPLTEGDGTD